MKNRMSLREFSQKIGIPPGTVSKAFHSGVKYRISPEKVAYIRNQAEELGFGPGTEKSLIGSRSLRIGFICGPTLEYIGSHFYNGVHDVCRGEGAALFLESCNHDVSQEQSAFRRMCAEHVDALIYWPGAKPMKDFSRRSLNKIERAVLENIPCVVIGHFASVANAFRMMYFTADAGRDAALRQRKMGCRKFLILRFLLTWQDDREAETAYRNTLLENGVSPRNIRTLMVGMNEPPERFAPFQDADGVWLNHLFLFSRYLPYIRGYTDLKSLHVDGIGYQEFFRSVRQVCSPLNAMLNLGEFFSDICGSSGVKFCSLYGLGFRAARRAVKLTSLPKTQWAGVESCPWVTEAEEKKCFPPLFPIQKTQRHPSV